MRQVALLLFMMLSNLKYLKNTLIFPWQIRVESKMSCKHLEALLMTSVQRMVWLFLFDMAKWINSGNYDQADWDLLKYPSSVLFSKKKSLIRYRKTHWRASSGACQQDFATAIASRWVGLLRQLRYQGWCEVDTWLNMMSTLLMVLSHEEIFVYSCTFAVTDFQVRPSNQLPIQPHAMCRARHKLVSWKILESRAFDWKRARYL